MQFLSKYSLKKYHTFGTDVYTKCFTEINSVTQFKDLLQEDIYKNNAILILGGGSNLLFTKNFNGLVVK
ncbi:MAG TPA: UDP-N-acetylenolpyruvoylglucosamine reductase, partial [Bacteroidia bacterium]|nr:UDP-N-acetylenolpyruvoylglucosamine reductase [Bacteroidia bacterium]